MLDRQYAVILSALLGLFLTGCHRLPFHRVDRSLDPRRLGQNSAEARPYPEVAVAQSEVPLPPLPLQPVSDHEALGQAEETPLLDAALARAQAEQDAVVGGPASPKPPDPEVVQAGARADSEVEAESGPNIPAGQNPAADQPAATTEIETSVESLTGPIRPRLEPVPDPEPLAETPEIGTLVDPTPLSETPAEMPPEEVSAEPPPPSEPASEVIQAESAPVDEAPPKAPLAIADMRLCRRVSGFGKFEPVEGPLRNGQVFVLYCELVGLHYEARGESYRSEIEATIELRGEADGRVVWSENLGRAEDSCRRPRQDFYVNYRLSLPGAEKVPPGSYRLVLRQRDWLAETEAVRETVISIAAPAR